MPKNARETPGKHPGNTRETPGKHPGNTQETPGIKGAGLEKKNFFSNTLGDFEQRKREMLLEVVFF